MHMPAKSECEPDDSKTDGEQYFKNLQGSLKGKGRLKLGDCSYCQFARSLFDFAGRTFTKRGFRKILPVNKH